LRATARRRKCRPRRHQRLAGYHAALGEDFRCWYQGDEVQKQVAEVAKALYQRADERAVLLARAITRRSWSSPLMFGCRRRGAALDRVQR
jgi:hypothetical protein